MLTCKKSYRDIPFAHRQHRHAGHCSLIHGHNWTITLTFGCNKIDENGFVIDFGQLKYIKNWIDENLDHACVFNKDDPELNHLLGNAKNLFKSYLVENCSSEGLAQHLYPIFDTMVRQKTEERAYVIEIEIEEDSKNSAAYRP